MLNKTLDCRVKNPLIDIFDIFSADHIYFRRWIRNGKIQILLWIRPNLQSCEQRVQQFSTTRVCEIDKNAGKMQYIHVEKSLPLCFLTKVTRLSLHSNEACLTDPLPLVSKSWKAVLYKASGTHRFPEKKTHLKYDEKIARKKINRYSQVFIATRYQSNC